MVEVKLPFKPNEKMIDLLAQLKDGRLTQAEFQTECAYWGLEYLDEYRCRPFPDAPDSLIQIHMERRSNPGKVVADEFWHRPEVAAYVRSVSFCIYKNWQSVGRLKMILGSLPEGDTMNRNRVIERLKDFTLWMDRYRKEIAHVFEKTEEAEPGPREPGYQEAEEDFFGRRA